MNILSDSVTEMNTNSNQSETLTETSNNLSNEEIKCRVEVNISVSKKPIMLDPILAPPRGKPKKPQKTTEIIFYHNNHNNKLGIFKTFENKKEKAGEEKYDRIFLEYKEQKKIIFKINYQNNNFEPIEPTFLNEKEKTTSLKRKCDGLGPIKESKTHRDNNKNQYDDTDVDEPKDKPKDIDNKTLKEKGHCNEEKVDMEELKDIMDQNMLENKNDNHASYEVAQKMDEKNFSNLDNTE